jgi:NitT/TauT family transport system substrate-binding protein
MVTHHEKTRPPLQPEGDANMQDRRYFMKAGFSLAAAGLAGAAALTGARRTLADEAVPETTSVRLGDDRSTCNAPVSILDDLLREEGFADVSDVPLSGTITHSFARGAVDFGLEFSAQMIIDIEAGMPMVMLAGVHAGCFELFARESIHSVGGLKGKSLGVGKRGGATHIHLSMILANVGLDPAKDVNWVFRRDEEELFAAGEIDAFLAAPPWAQELHARNVGHVIFSTTLDHPWSQYFCCTLMGHADFVRRCPIATKRVVRAMLRATEICAAKPDWVAQRLVDRGFTPRYDYARQGLYDIPFRSWRDYDVEDSVRFYALRLRELGFIKSSPDKIIATGTDWRFLKEVRKELGI